MSATVFHSIATHFRQRYLSPLQFPGAKRTIEDRVSALENRQSKPQTTRRAPAQQPMSERPSPLAGTRTEMRRVRQDHSSNLDAWHAEHSGAASDLLHTFNARMDTIQAQKKPSTEGGWAAYNDVFGPKGSAPATPRSTGWQDHESGHQVRPLGRFTDENGRPSSGPVVGGSPVQWRDKPKPPEATGNIHPKVEPVDLSSEASTPLHQQQFGLAATRGPKPKPKPTIPESTMSWNDFLQQHAGRQGVLRNDGKNVSVHFGGASPSVVHIPDHPAHSQNPKAQPAVAPEPDPYHAAPFVSAQQFRNHFAGKAGEFREHTQATSTFHPADGGQHVIVGAKAREMQAVHEGPARKEHAAPPVTPGGIGRGTQRGLFPASEAGPRVKAAKQPQEKPVQEGPGKGQMSLFPKTAVTGKKTPAPAAKKQTPPAPQGNHDAEWSSILSGAVAENQAARKKATPQAPVKNPQQFRETTVKVRGKSQTIRTEHAGTTKQLETLHTKRVREAIDGLHRDTQQQALLPALEGLAKAQKSGVNVPEAKERVKRIQKPTLAGPVEAQDVKKMAQPDKVRYNRQVPEHLHQYVESSELPLAPKKTSKK